MQNGACPVDVNDCPHLERSAELAVKKVFAILGVDIDVPKDVEEFRENLRFGADMRKVADRGRLALITVIAAAIVYGLWNGIVTTINKGN